MQQSQKELIIHIGYPKAGSSWLQEKLFKVRDEWCFALERRADIHGNIIGKNELGFDGERIKKTMINRINSRCKEDQVPVISSEALAGHPDSGGYNSCYIADRLKKVFGSAKVLILVREQRRMIYSCYKQFVSSGGSVSLERYIHPRFWYTARIPSFSLDYFHFDRLVKYYSKRYGRDNVLVLPLELLRFDPYSFFESVYEFAGLSIGQNDLANLVEKSKEKVNKGINSIGVSAKRLANVWIGKNDVNRKPIFDITKYLNQFVGNKVKRYTNIIPKNIVEKHKNRKLNYISMCVGNRYIDTNRELSRIMGLDLSKYDYMM